MKDAGLKNLHWSRHTAAALYHLGVRTVCVSPGARNSPLTFAFVRHGRFTLYSVIDERSAGYFALGLAKFSDAPVVLLCTSGTATANYYPAIIEANLGRIPLIVLTADRPAALVGTGANQTLNQQNLYGRQVRWFRDVGLPHTAKAALSQHLRSAVLMALGLDSSGRKVNPPGPVHLNFPFDEPLLPENYSDDDLKRPLARDPLWDLNPADSAAAGSAFEALPATRHPLIVAGGLPPGTDADSILALAAALKAPVFADPVSQLRYGPGHENVITGYDLFLDETALEPDLVLRFGRKPTSKKLCRQLDLWGPITTLIDPVGRFNDDCPEVVSAEIGEYCRRQLALISTKQTVEWLTRIRSLDQTVREIGERNLKVDTSCEGYLVKAVIETLVSETNLILGNSMPIRYADRFTGPSLRRIKVFANRGASGIDGVLSTALGIAAASKRRENLLIIGDLSFYHDLNSLLAANRYEISLTIVLINNNGGGIFSFLPLQALKPPEFTEFWATPHALDFSEAARLYGCAHKRVLDINSLQQYIGESFTLPGIKILEFQTDPEWNLSLAQRLSEKIHRTLTASQ
ncbi:MAG: 2-succinyl-5-enolpyruvyl-6-hydroxy-3-cyclohexene-1-carboxylic-acid synthase [FCB group bacterium]|nr:2-succinyl-5-enolpyruvyl-6-hydroxy-3-cyclohexene-1-carboxylic-acid synthase [FCB group bacterium]